MDIDLTGIPEKPVSEKDIDLTGIPSNMSSIKAGEDISIYEKMANNLKRYFKGDDAEKATLALVDSEMLNISPSAAWEYQDAINDGIKGNPKQFTLRSNAMERIKQSWNIGVQQNKAGELAFQYVRDGNEDALNQAISEMAKIPTEEERFLSKSLMEDSFREAAQLSPMMFDSSIEGGTKGLLVGMGFGTAMALTSAATRNPELAAGIPAATLLGFKIGAAEGVFESSMRKEAGLALLEIINLEDEEGNKLDPQLARYVAAGIGIINGAIEIAQFKTLLKSIPGANRLFSRAIMEAVTSKSVKSQLINLAQRYAGTVATETGQEIAQESTNIILSEIGVSINNALEGTDIDHQSIDDIYQRLKETAESSVKGFAVIAAPGPIVSLAGIRSENTQVNKDAKTIVEKTGNTFKEVITDEKGKPESIILIDPETKQEISISINSSESQIKQAVNAVQQEMEASIDELIESDIDIEKIEEISLKELEAPKIDLNDRESLAPILQELDENRETPGLASSQIESLANAVFDEGTTDEQTFMNRMKVVLGDLWEAFKELVKVAFDKITEERGSIYFLKPKEVKPQIKKVTGQVKEKIQVSEREALKGGLRKQEQISKQVYKEGIKEGIKQTQIPKPETIKGRIARTTGLKKINELVREDEALKAAFTKAVQAARKAYREGNKEGVLVEKARMQEILKRATEHKTRKDLMAKIKNISQKAIKGGIAVDYKKKIKELLSGFEFKKPTEKTVQRLKGLSDYLNKNGRPLGINQKHIDKIDRLSKKSLKDLSTEELQSLKNTLSLLVQLGKLKAKLTRFADAREKEKKLNELIDSTVNIDSRPPETYAARKRKGRFKKQNERLFDTLRNYYTETLHTPRVADMLDGFQNYQGPNAKMIKEELLAEQGAIENTINRITEFLNKLSEIDIGEEVTDEQQIRIMIHARYQEGAYDAVNILLEYYGYEIPEGTLISDNNPLSNYVPLSAEESQLIDLIRDIVTEKTAAIAALHEELTNEIFDIEPDYVMPLLYEKDIVSDPSSLLRHDFQDTDLQGNIVRRTKKTPQGFTISRKLGVKKVPRVDIFDIIEEAIAVQEWYLNLQPVLINHADLVFDKTYQEKAGQKASQWWRDQIDIVARHGWKAGIKHNAGLHAIRQNLNRGVLLYKLSTIFMQPFAVIDAMAYANNKYGITASAEIMKEFIKSWLNPKYAKKIIDASIALQQREGGEVAMEEILRETAKKDNLFSKFEKGGFTLIQKSDLITAAGVRQGIMKVLEKEGVENTENEADFIMNMTQGSANISMRPHILASGEGHKLLFTFQTFFLNRWGILWHDIIKSGFKGNWKIKLASLLSLGIFMAGGMGEREARRRLANFLKKKDIEASKPEDIIYDAIFYVPEQMPLIGNILESTRHGYGGELPITRTTKQLTRGIYNIAKGEVGKGMMQLGESGLILWVGLPGTTQMFDFFEYMIEEDKNRRGNYRRQ